MTINCNGQLISLEKPKVMGVLNLTPDSFFDGGKFNSTSSALFQCEKMIREGVDFIDLGAYSSRPGAAEVAVEEEKKRLLPVLEALLNAFPKSLFSIDTFRATVAEEAIAIGAVMINDISAGNLDPEMLNVVGKYSIPYIAMHMQGTPKTMQKAPQYDDLLSELISFFSKKINRCREAGINDIIIDPGFGFGKTIEHNYRLLKDFDAFQQFGTPVLAGVSRKSMIYKLLNTQPENALNGTSVLHTIALMKKAQFLRVHDVKEAKECIELVQQIL